MSNPASGSATMGAHRMVVLLLLQWTLMATALENCERTPDFVRGPKSNPDGRFRISMSANPLVYVPREMYTVKLNSSVKFTQFSLWLEAAHGNVGNLHLFGDSFTKYSDQCSYTITESSNTPKTEIQALWNAPVSGSGCVSFKATVVEQPDLWYQVDGPLTYTICEDLQEISGEQRLMDCCACDEAKYEVSFEGLWSRQTHPKDFPEGENTRFSDVIGASHTIEYRFWDYGGIATEGLREVAEMGSTRTLESELKSQSQHIRTIIKARGIAYPNVTGKTFAVFRVDNKHHLISLVSMLMPSPDWIVGVSGLELCLSNCTWVETYVRNLYPWDAGTDSGVTYLSPDNQTEPKDRIRRITAGFPSDPKSPFYNPSGDLKPLARLYLTRQRLYEKSCTAPNPDNPEEQLLMKFISPSINKDEMQNNGSINRQDEPGNQTPLSLFHLQQLNRVLDPTLRPIIGYDGPVIDCKVSGWNKWERCSVTCGEGYKRKTRRIIQNARNGGRACPSKLLKTRKCNPGPCFTDDNPNPPDYEEDSQYKADDCVYSEWTAWSQCTPSCGLNSLQTRSRKTVKYYKHSRNCADRIETRVCNVLPCID